MSRSADYSVYFSDQYGNRLADASNFTSLEYARTVNSVGALTLTLPGDYPLYPIIVPDGRIEVWRRVAGGREYLDTDTVWLIKALEQRLAEDGTRSIVVEAKSLLCLIDEPGRFVDAAAGSAAASKEQAADDMIKVIVREQAGAGASVGRQYPGLQTQGLTASATPTIKAFAWRTVLTVCQELAQETTEGGTYLAFDMVSLTPQSIQFQTFVGQRGIDRRFPSSPAPLIVGPDFGNVGAAVLRIDYADEITYAKAAGSGEGSARLTNTYQDTERTARSPFGRREVFVSANGYLTLAGLEQEATARVRAGRPALTFSGQLLSTPDTQYGIHWGWGDYLTVQAFGQQFDCRVDAITVSVSGDEERIQAVLRGETYG